MLLRYERKSMSIFDKLLESVGLIYTDNLPTNQCRDIAHGKAICNLHWKHFFDMKKNGVVGCRGSGCQNLVAKKQEWCDSCMEVWAKAA